MKLLLLDEFLVWNEFSAGSPWLSTSSKKPLVFPVRLSRITWWKDKDITGVGDVGEVLLRGDLILVDHGGAVHPFFFSPLQSFGVSESKILVSG